MKSLNMYYSVSGSFFSLLNILSVSFIYFCCM